jgi:hypothetical protein
LIGKVKGVSPLAAPADARYFWCAKSTQKRCANIAARPAAGFPPVLTAGGVCRTRSSRCAPFAQTCDSPLSAIRSAPPAALTAGQVKSGPLPQIACGRALARERVRAKPPFARMRPLTIEEFSFPVIPDLIWDPVSVEKTRKDAGLLVESETRHKWNSAALKLPRSTQKAQSLSRTRCRILVLVITEPHARHRTEPRPSGFGCGFDFEDLKGAEKRRGEWKEGRCMSERKERSDWSEFSGPHSHRASQGTRAQLGRHCGKSAFGYFCRHKSTSPSAREAGGRNALEVEFDLDGGIAPETPTGSAPGATDQKGPPE